MLPGTQQKENVINPGGAGGYVKVRVAATGVNASVETQFTNDPAYGELKVCKVADASSAGLTGTPFTFTATQGGYVSSPESIPAAAPGNPYSSCFDFGGYRVGSTVSVAEDNTPGVQVDSVITSNGTNTPPVMGSTTTTSNVTLTGGVTEVSFDNGYIPPTVTGNLEVCEVISDPYVPAGPWAFQIYNSAGRLIDSENVISGQCNEVLPSTGLAPGQYTVTETVPYPYYTDYIWAIPGSDLLSTLPPNTAVFNVVGGQATTAFFENDTLQGYVKVCKELAPGVSSLTSPNGLSGQTFDFNITDSAVPGYLGTVSVVAQAGMDPCSIDYTSLPAGSTATVTEQAVPNVAVTQIGVIPSSAGTVNGTTSASVTVSPTNINGANFTDDALGWVEICKYAGDGSVSGSFPFTVNGMAINPIAVNGCSSAIQVPAGEATINETETNPDYYVSSVTAIGYTPIETNQLVSWAGPGNTSATVNVPYGGVGVETNVAYTNSTLTGYFKICTGQTSGDAALTGYPFTFNWSYTLNGVTSTGTTSPPLVVPATGTTCTNPIPSLAGIQVINSNGTPVQLTVTAEPNTGLIGVDLASFSYAGLGMPVTSPPDLSTLPATAVVDLGPGANMDTFILGASH